MPDPVMIAIALLAWPLTRSLVFMGAALTHMWSRSPHRRSAAERIMRIIGTDST
ncbi:hypothetical protein GCM10010172_60910 [Paractinoplanes ferrugineus]|uniref:Uncharacterized protein n=1 Tax=Paractinoplanes ferrugineus TaxID=113564 RepID=A0A919MCD1_9ACTN|nr:hypothetical protein [Actinoplanes ferrugineus]GIE14581.1 hypothetical protein Afe05nite_64210 [Actinoplanes ferrugineus]